MHLIPRAARSACSAVGLAAWQYPLAALLAVGLRQLLAVITHKARPWQNVIGAVSYTHLDVYKRQEQIKTIDKRRVLSYIGRVSREEMRAIDDALQVSLDIHIPEEMEAP